MFCSFGNWWLNNICDCFLGVGGTYLLSEGTGLFARVVSPILPPPCFLVSLRIYIYENIDQFLTGDTITVENVRQHFNGSQTITDVGRNWLEFVKAQITTREYHIMLNSENLLTRIIDRYY